MIDRIRALFRLGRVTLVDDSDVVQRVQVDEGSVGPLGGRRILDKVPKFGHFGHASVPPVGSEVIMAAFGGERTQTVAIGSNHQPSRLKGFKPGDSALYDVRGARVQLTADGLLIDAADLPVRLQNATTVTIVASGKVRVEAGALEVTGDIVSRADGTRVSLNGLRDAYAAHKHTGVAAGAASSGLTDHVV